jgi:hypothetical protein
VRLAWFLALAWPGGLVRAAVKVMYVGATVSTVNLIIFLALLGDIGAYHTIREYHLTAAQASQALNPLAITEAIVTALVPIALWLWMARETGRAGTGHEACPRCCSAWPR